MKDMILSRLREPSTYAGIAVVVGGLSFVPHALDYADTIRAAGMFIAALLAIWLPEKKL